MATLVSVIIPVYNDAARLEACLQALENQTYDAYEVIVVDNASNETLAPLVKRFGRARYAHEAQGSSYAARNKGLSVARGKILAFTDADCIPRPDWIEKGIARLHSASNVGLVGGKVDLFPVDPDHLTAAECYESFAAFRQDRAVTLKNYSATANLFTFRHVVEVVGEFDGQLISGGDVEWGRRVHSAGYTMLFGEDVRVAHPLRHTLAELCARHTRFARAEYDMSDLATYSLPRFVVHLIASLLPQPAYLCRMLTTKRVHSWRQRLTLILVEGYVRSIQAVETVRLRRALS